MRRNGADLDTIAKQLGVSKTTVHYALTNTGRISDATRQRVVEMAEKLGYRPNLTARSLRSRRSALLGVVVVDLTSSYYAHVLEGIDGVAQQQEYSMLVACSYGSPEKERAAIDLLVDQGADGLVVMPVDPEANSDYYIGLVADGIHLVFVDRYVPRVNVDSVSTDNVMGGYLAGQHLVRAGRKRIAVVLTPSRERRSTSVQARLSGCAQALREADLDPPLVVGSGVVDRAPDEQFAYHAVRDFLRAVGRDCDGIFAVHDGLAYGAVEALVESGRDVPRDVSVVGFDDRDSSAYFHPPLTTVRQPMREIGEEAVRLLFRRFQEGTPAVPRQRLALEPTLVIRRSCGAAEAPNIEPSEHDSD